MKLSLASTWLLCVSMVLADSAAFGAARSRIYEPLHLETKMTIGDRHILFKVSSLFVLPGEELQIDYAADSLSDVSATAGTLVAISAGSWRWLAPLSPGTDLLLEFRTADGDIAVSINVFVMVPATAVVDGMIGDYRIDDYPDPDGLSATANYEAPVGFVKVSSANRSRRVSPHLTIGQFVAKQQGDWPKYVVPGPELYTRLEQVLAVVNAQGFRSDSLTVMSGYRTPYYNALIGNVAYSRHIYGDAADIFVDLDGDDVMDDLNRDGVVDRKDAETLASWVKYPTEPMSAEVDGGVGIYAPAAWRGPFVHIDTRGTRARWVQ